MVSFHWNIFGRFGSGSMLINIWLDLFLDFSHFSDFKALVLTYSVEFAARVVFSCDEQLK